MRLLVLVLAATLSVPLSCNAQVLAVGPQYDSSHVYVPASDFDRFVASFVATFGGTAGKRSTVTVTPTPSSTINQPLHTPSGMVSAFGFLTPIPAPFGSEHVGYMVSDMDGALAAARACGAAVIVDAFPDPIGKDAIVQWPGGVTMQFYWHSAATSYDALSFVPDYRVYVAPEKADAFVASFVRFSGGHVVSDDITAPGADIGRPADTVRRIRLTSLFGKMTVLVSDGHLPYPYGRETTGYEVSDLEGTLKRALSAGASVLVQPYELGHMRGAMVEFPGGYVAEIHAPEN